MKHIQLDYDWYKQGEENWYRPAGSERLKIASMSDGTRLLIVMLQRTLIRGNEGDDLRRRCRIC